MTQIYFGRKLLRVRRPEHKRKLFQNRESKILSLVQLTNWICRVSHAIYLGVANVIISSVITLLLSPVTNQILITLPQNNHLNVKTDSFISEEDKDSLVILRSTWRERTCWSRHHSSHRREHASDSQIMYVYPSGWTRSNLCAPNRLSCTKAESHDTRLRKR
jgi:hypothetical protein